MKKKKKNIFDQIDDYLYKKSHDKYMSLILDGYNGNFIYVRFDYVEKIKAYKIIWVDLRYIDEKNICDYINSQLVTSVLANKILDVLEAINEPSESRINEEILGDKVTVLNYVGEEIKEYTFSRFLPEDWKFLVDLFVLVFSYLPRSMEVFLNEIFGELDGLKNEYNAKKAIKFNLLNDDFKKIFSKQVCEAGEKLFNLGKVKFLEKVDSKYLAIVDLPKPVLVIFNQVNDDFVFLWCSCDKHIYCEHIFGVLLALRNEQFNDFYKVTFSGDKRTLLDKVRDGIYYYCLGEKDGNLLLISDNAEIFSVPIVEKGKCMFDVIEDDDNCTLSTILKKYQNK